MSRVFCRVPLCGVLLFAGVSKSLFLLSADDGAWQAEAFQPVGPVGAVFFTISELLIGFLLLSRFWRQASMFALWLFLGFALYLTWAFLYGRPASSCGCFGNFELNYAGHFALLAGSILLCVSCRLQAPKTVFRLRLKALQKES